jgi:hypothetical protein
MCYSPKIFLSYTKAPRQIGGKDLIFGFFPLRARAVIGEVFCSGTELMSRTNLSSRRKQKEVAN